MKTSVKHFIAIMVLLFTLEAQADSSQNSALIDSIKYNVIKIKATFTDNPTQSGFGFIVGADESNEYYVTANHVVRNLTGPASDIKVTFYDKSRSKQKVELLEKSDLGLDLAVLKITKRQDTFGLWRRDALGTVETGGDIWFLGQGSKWTVPNQPGQISNKPAECATVSDPKATLSVENMKTRKGTSGAPLLSTSGIVGMMLCSGEKQVALKIDRIREKIESNRWQLPWGLSPRKPTVDLTGRYQYWDKWDGDDAKIKLVRLDEVHYSFEAETLLGAVTLGKLVVDGDKIYSEFRSRIAGDVSLELKIQKDVNGRYTNVASGMAYDHDPNEDPYEVRVTRIGKNHLAPMANDNHRETTTKLPVPPPKSKEKPIEPITPLEDNNPPREQDSVSTISYNLTGSWREIIFGRDMGIARIEQDGPFLKLWNFEFPAKFSNGNLGGSDDLRAHEWQLTAKISKDRKTINWSNGVVWIRVAKKNGTPESNTRISLESPKEQTHSTLASDLVDTYWYGRFLPINDNVPLHPTVKALWKKGFHMHFRADGIWGFNFFAPGPYEYLPVNRWKKKLTSLIIRGRKMKYIFNLEKMSGKQEALTQPTGHMKMILKTKRK